MSARRWTSSRRQRGWSLVESAIALLLVGVLATGLWKTMELVSKNHRGEQSREVLQRVEDALYGMALRDLRLPMPDDATSSVNQPNHWVGWLPERVLGSGPTRRIRYIVDKGLVDPPADLRYRADPMGLVQGATWPPRSEANGLDFCLHIIQRERAGVAVANDVSLAWSVTDSAGASLAQVTGFQIDQVGAQAAEEKDARNTRSAGHLELVHRLGCIQGFARLTAEVKSAALFSDLHTIAEINADLKALALQGASDSLRSHQWRYAVAIVNLYRLSISTAVIRWTIEYTRIGAPIAIGQLTSLSLAIALFSQLAELSEKSIKRSQENIPLIRQDHANAQAYAMDLAAQRDWHLDRVNRFQNLGVRP